MADVTPRAAGVSVFHRSFRSISTSTRGLQEASKAGRWGETGTAAEFPTTSAKGAECGSVDGLAYSRLLFTELAIVKTVLFPYL